MSISHKEELKNRVQAKKKELEAKLETAKADSRRTAREGVEQIEKSLKELEELTLKGWDEVTEGLAKKLNDWLGR